MNVGKNTIGAELLRGYVERMEHLDAQKKQIAQDQAVVMAEAKSQGLVPAAIRFVLKKRKMKPSDRAEAEAMEDVYLHAMGMAAETPLFRAVGLIGVDIAARDSVVEAMKKFVPQNGSIAVEAAGATVRLTRDAAGNVSVAEVVEKPVETKPKGAQTPRAAKPAPPDVDVAGAYALGCAAFRADVAVIANPFPYGDARRAHWDKGWRDESGGDGMGG